MNSHLFGNPHSNSPSSVLSTDSVESARLQALHFFRADPEHFDLIFVANATAAIKLVLDCLSDYRRCDETSQLDFSDLDTAPDFTAVSFYKIFGFPDLGALIVRKGAGHVLAQRRYFGGGTVDMIINGKVNGPGEDMWHAKKSMSLHEMLEDGTRAFHSIAALNSAFKVHRRLFGSMTKVAEHTRGLIERLYEMIAVLCHADGLLLCKIYKGSFSQYDDFKTQGPTIAFNVRDSKGGWIGKSEFERTPS